MNDHGPHTADGRFSTMRPGDLGIGRRLHWALLAAMLTPIVSGTLVAIRHPLADIGTRGLIGLWVEFEVLILAAAAVVTGYVRAGSERRRRGAIGELRRRAVRDPLTALLNRRGLLSLLSRKTWASEGAGRSALLIDLDGFKRINDMHGHITGDRVLLAVADSLLELVGDGWLAARLGGDEFLLVRRGADLGPDEAEAVIARLPEALRQLGLPAVTASFGRALDPAGRQSLEVLIAAADRDLGRARGIESVPINRFGGRLEDGSSDLLVRGRELIDADRKRRSKRVREVAYLRRIGTACAGLALLLSSLAVLAVPLDLTWLRTVEPQGALAFTSSTMLAFAALVLLYFFAEPQPSAKRLRRCRAGGWLITVVGAMVVLEHLTGRTLLPTELINDPLEGTVSKITRPDLETGLGFVFGGIYTGLLRRDGRLVQTFKTAVSLGLIAIVAGAAFGVLLGAGYLWQGGAPALSPQGMLAGALLSIALLVAEPRQPLLRLFLSGGGAAQISNTLVAAGISVPLIGGAILVHLDLAEGLGWEVAVMVVALLQATILTSLAIMTLRAVARSDEETATIWRQLSEVADRDPLTGLFTRDRFNREVDLSRRQLGRDGRPYSVVLLDLDQLKSLNSSLGYTAGDQALCDVALALQTGVRPSDLPVRLGGDEFGILLPGAIESEAEEIARRCADRIEAAQAGDKPLRASWGVATAAGVGADPEALLDLADRRLYEAKRKVLTM